MKISNKVLNDLLWMSMRYCIGRHTIASSNHAYEIANIIYDNPGAFNGEYGVTEATYELEESEFNANSKSRRKKLHERQKPGVSPLVYSRFLIDCAVFLSLNDMGKHLPDYEEIPV